MAVELERLGFSVDSSGVERGAERVNRALDKIERQIDSTFQKFKNFNKGLMASVSAGVLPNVSRRIAATEAAERKHQQSLERIQAQATAKQAAQARQLENQLQSIRARREAAETRHQQRLNEIAANGAQRRTANTGGGFGGLVAGASAIAGGRIAISQAGDIQNLERAFSRLDGSKSGETLVRLRKQADDAALSFTQFAASVAQVRASQKLTADQTERLILGLTNVRRQTGATVEAQERAVAGITQVLAKGKLSAEELRGQILEAVPSLGPLIEKKFGTLDAEKLEKKFGAKKFVSGLIEELSKVEKLKPTGFERFQKSINDLKLAAAPLGEILLNRLTPGIAKLAELSNKAASGFDRLAPATKDSLVNFGLIATATGLLIANFDKLIGLAGRLAGGLRGGLIGGAIGLLAEPLLQSDEQIRERFRQLQRQNNGERVPFGPGTEEEPSAGRLRPGVREALRREAQRRAAGLTGGGGASRGAKTETELQQLAKRLAEVNKEINELQTRTSPEYKLKLAIEGGEETRKVLSDLLQIQAELGIKPQTPTRQVQVAPGKFRNILDFDAAKEQRDAFNEIKNRPISDAFNGLRGGVGKIDGGNDSSEFERVIKQDEERLKKQETSLEKQLRIIDALDDSAASLTDQIDALGDVTEEQRERRRLRRLNVGFDDPLAQRNLGIARQVDETVTAQKRYQDAVEESIRANERFKQTVESLFESLLDSPKRFLDQVKGLLKSFAASTLTSLVFGGNRSSAGGGFGGFSGGGQGGSGGILGGIQNVISGSLGGIGPGGTAPFNPSGAGGGFNLGGGILGGLLNKGIGKLGGLFGFGGGGASRIASGAVNAAKGGASAGGGFLSALGFSNPISAIITGGLIAAPFVAKLFGGLFGGGTEKELGKAIQNEYGLKTEKEIQKQVKAIGDQQFSGSGGAKRNILGTIKLRPSKESLYEYALSTGQTGSKLVREFELERNLGNPNFSANRFVKREFGGRVYPGNDYLVGEKRAEVVRFDSPGTVYPSFSDYTSKAGNGPSNAALLQMVQANTVVLMELANAVANLRGIKPGNLIAIGASENPQALAQGARRGFSESQPEMAEFNRVNGY
jgi:tape measure domain-containing protein